MTRENMFDPRAKILTTATPLTCPHCNKNHDVSTGRGTPEPGDLSICWGCADLAVFITSGGGLRAPTDEERAEFMKDQTVRVAIAAVKRCEGQNPAEVMRKLTAS